MTYADCLRAAITALRANLLRSMQGLIVEAANEGGLSGDEVQANQLQIDSAVASRSLVRRASRAAATMVPSAIANGARWAWRSTGTLPLTHSIRTSCTAAR